MQIITKLEKNLGLLRTINSFSYRSKMFGDSEAEMMTLKGRAGWTNSWLHNTKQPFYESLLNFLPPKMAELYVNSRFFVPEFLYEHFYKGVLGINIEE